MQVSVAFAFQALHALRRAAAVAAPAEDRAPAKWSICCEGGGDEIRDAVWAVLGPATEITGEGGWHFFDGPLPADVPEGNFSVENVDEMNDALVQTFSEEGRPPDLSHGIPCDEELQQALERFGWVVRNIEFCVEVSRSPCCGEEQLVVDRVVWFTSPVGAILAE